MQLIVRQGFKSRLFQAHAALEGREGVRIGREEIGRRVGKALSAEPIPQSTVASWFGEILPPADVGAALALVYGVNAGWLYFGEEGGTVTVTTPADPKTGLTRITRQDVERKKRGRA